MTEHGERLIPNYKLQRARSRPQREADIGVRRHFNLPVGLILIPIGPTVHEVATGSALN